MTVYLLHFDRRINPDHPTRHYIGWAPEGSLRRRLERHAAGRGARLLQVAIENRVGWRLARTWPGANRGIELAIKSLRQAPELCPICRPFTRQALKLRAPRGDTWERRRLSRPGLRFRYEPKVEAAV